MTTNDPYHPQPILQRVRWVMRASMLQRGAAATRGPKRDILRWLLSSLYLPLPFLPSLIHPIRQTQSTTLQLPFNCDPSNYGIRLRNTCIRMSTPSTSYCIALMACPHYTITTQLLLRGMPRPSSPPATGVLVWLPYNGGVVSSWRCCRSILLSVHRCWFRL